MSDHDPIEEEQRGAMNEAPTEIDKLHRRIWELEVENQKLREDKEKLQALSQRLSDRFVAAWTIMREVQGLFDKLEDRLSECS